MVIITDKDKMYKHNLKIKVIVYINKDRLLLYY